MTAKAAPSTPQETPPEWDLSDLYQGPDDPAIEQDLARAAEAATAFSTRHKGALSLMGGGALGAAIAEYETISEQLGRISGYADLLFAANVGDDNVARFSQTVRERITDIASDVLFFTLEINKIKGDVVTEQMKDPACARYAPWLRQVRAFRAHQLGDDLEEMLHDKSVTGRMAWVRLFEETITAMRFDVAGKELPIADTLDLLSDTDGATRKAAAHALGEGLGGRIQLFSLVTNTLAKDKAIEDEKRRYKRPVSMRNLENQVEDEVVDALVSSVKTSYPALSHRYYALKAGWFGSDRLDYWDRNAPVPGDDAARYTWGEARTLVLDAYGAFAPDMAAVAERFFDKRWIDASLRPTKDSGAFSHPLVPSVHPYILMNYHGRARDVMTLAHELGHGVHQVLAAGQGALLADTPLTTAETASVFGEMLTFQSMLKGEDDPKRRRILIAGKVEDMLNTVVRQIAFHEFERRVHDRRREGELTAEELCQVWMEVQRESLGPALHFEEAYKVYWTYIPHFIHTPFYVYAYAFGDGLVNALYAVYEEGGEGFQDKYFAMLKAGGSKHHKELLAPFGLDATDPDFWAKGLGMISGMIDELEAMED